MFLDPILRGEYPADVPADLAPYGLDDYVPDGDLNADRRTDRRARRQLLLDVAGRGAAADARKH